MQIDTCTCCYNVVNIRVVCCQVGTCRRAGLIRSTEQSVYWYADFVSPFYVSVSEICYLRFIRWSDFCAMQLKWAGVDESGRGRWRVGRAGGGSERSEAGLLVGFISFIVVVCTILSKQ